MTGGMLTVETLEARMIRLERENGSLRKGGLLLALGLAAIMLLAASGTSDRQTAQEYRLVDPQGNLRALLGFHNNQPTLSFLNASGDPSLAMGIQGGVTGIGGESGIAFYDETGKPRVSLILYKFGGSLQFWEAGKNRVALGIDTTGPRLGLFNVAGEPQANLTATAQGAELSVLGSASKAVVSLISTSGTSGLRLVDGNGKVRGEFGLGPTGPIVALKAADGKTVIFQKP
jgi:hypothetical protein